MRLKRLVLFIISLTLISSISKADDFGSWLSVGTEKKINKKTSVEIEGELRVADDFNRISRWSIAASADYKLMNFLKFDAGYKFIMNHNAEALVIDEDGDYLSFTPSLWTSRHRISSSLTGSYSFGRFKVSLRERWQYTYRPELEYGTFQYTTQKWKIKKGKGKNLSRTRIKGEYSPKKKPYSFSADAEIYFDGNGLNKIRYTIGGEYKFDKRNVFNVFYKYIDRKEEENGSLDSNIIGIGYKYKF